MARKSRKETAAVAVQEADAACRAAIYVRLSVEDTHTHSVSIETQQMIIARYLEQYPEISVYDTYIDNGATGTNFHRPGFQQMLSDIEAGHVNCVIVKDLSRLGRNTIDTGYYIEQYFRIRNIRFIAVNENFDTAAPEDAHSGIIIPLRRTASLSIFMTMLSVGMSGSCISFPVFLRSSFNWSFLPSIQRLMISFSS